MIRNLTIYFDGVCNFCNSSVQFIIKRDPLKKFRFAALQSKVGQEMLKKFHLKTTELDTMILVAEDKYYTKSTAALQIARRMAGLWPVLFGLIIIPRFIRNLAYDFIARNRYKWFGKKEKCMIPSPDLMNRFLN